MFGLRPLPRFRRHLKKLLHKDRMLAERVATVLDLIAKDPRNPTLNSHKVTANDGRKAFSSELTPDLRIIWRYAADQIDLIDLVDIGGHSGARKVYR